MKAEENKNKQINELLPFFSYKDYNGGTLREWRIFCSNGDGGEGFYKLTKEECAAEAWNTGWRVVKGRPICNYCSRERK